MRIAIPIVGNEISAHFGHCEKFALLDVDPENKTIGSTEYATPPAHEPGVLPQWLQTQQVHLIIAGGIGNRAQQLFAQHQIEVIAGVAHGSAEQIAQMYLDGTLQSSNNLCDH